MKIECPECGEIIEEGNARYIESGVYVCDECGRDFWFDPDEHIAFPGWDYYGN